MDLQGRVFDTLIMCFLKSWTLPEQVSMEAVEDLDSGTKDALLRAAMPLIGEMMPDFGDNPADPKAVPSGSGPRDGPSSTAAISEIRSFATTS